MVSAQQVEQYIAAELNCTHLAVEGDGQHFFATVVSEAFAGKRLLARHRLINDIVKTRLLNNEIHALSIVKALTPDEWAGQQG
jgi:acid stress-induced BolA-like protein IbaG/YrbA